MAATPFDASGPGSSFVFDIYNDGQPTRNAPPPALVLPGGPCNYTDASLPRCGCRRFWSRISLRGAFPDNLAGNLAEVCMCSHHACFHEDGQPGVSQPPPATVANVVGQENQKPRSNREPLSPVQDLGVFQPSNLGSSLDFNLLNFQSQQAVGHRVDEALPFPMDDVRPAPDTAMPDTLTSWDHLIQSQTGCNNANDLPPIPSQCLLPSSQPSSTTSSSQARYLRPFAGKGLHTLSGGSALRNEVPQLEDENSKAVVVRTDRDATPTPGPSQDRRSASISHEAWQKLSNTVDSHEQRLDKLENASFSVAGHDECHDKHESTDLRVTELESRVEEVEKLLNDSNSVASSRRTAQRGDDATASVVSVATDATVLGSRSVEMYSQLQSLQAQVHQLQAASLPSYTKPWELEVVFLPFPLKGIWMEAHEFPSQRRSTGSNAGDWTQMPNTLSRATPDPQSPKFQEWAGQGADSNWLLPRAFAAGRMIDQRLKSRGLIKTVLVRGPDARSIQLAVHQAFGDVFRISSNAGSRHNSLPSDFLGLRQPWVPLRKLHKDSRLRFLAPSEMATPALWDFTFLVSSVVMKATGTHRLYVTQPEAYLQDHPLGYQAFESGWTWQKLRELSRVYPDSQSSDGDATVPEADAMEECWAWTDRLDEEPTANTSALSLRHTHQRPSRGSSTSPSSQFYTGIESPILSASQGLPRAQSPMTQRTNQSSRPLYIRTTSLPPSGPAMASPSQSRRRISHLSNPAYERRSSPLISRSSPRPSMVMATTISKRRLGTRSPSLAPRNTPRWSRTSMSRSPSLAPLAYQDERRTTPFYYATPHSDAIPEYRAGSRPPPPTNGYDPDVDEDMSGSSTDPYDSEMNDDTFGLGVGRDDDVDVYEDEDEDELDGVTTDEGGWGRVVRPEDIPWAGIEDRDMEDGENVAPGNGSFAVHEDGDMEIGEGEDSQPPSEYSSRQSAWISEGDGFEIHEDGGSGPETQWE